MPIKETKTMCRSDPAVTEHLVVNSNNDLATNMLIMASISDDAGWTSSYRDSTFSNNDSGSSSSSSSCE